MSEKVRKLFAGPAGHWFAWECLPPYVLVFLAWPAALLFTNGGNSPWRLFLQTFAAPDYWAVAICLLLAGLSTQRHSAEVGEIPENSLFYAQVVVSLLICTLFYWATKINPVEVSLDSAREIPVRAYILVGLSWLVAIYTSTLIYRRVQES